MSSFIEGKFPVDFLSVYLVRRIHPTESFAPIWFISRDAKRVISTLFDVTHNATRILTCIKYALFIALLLQWVRVVAVKNVPVHPSDPQADQLQLNTTELCNKTSWRKATLTTCPNSEVGHKVQAPKSSAQSVGASFSSFLCSVRFWWWIRSIPLRKAMLAFTLFKAHWKMSTPYLEFTGPFPSWRPLRKSPFVHKRRLWNPFRLWPRMASKIPFITFKCCPTWTWAPWLTWSESSACTLETLWSTIESLKSWGLSAQITQSMK